MGWAWHILLSETAWSNTQPWGLIWVEMAPVPKGVWTKVNIVLRSNVIMKKPGWCVKWSTHIHPDKQVNNWKDSPQSMKKAQTSQLKNQKLNSRRRLPLSFRWGASSEPKQLPVVPTWWLTTWCCQGFCSLESQASPANVNWKTESTRYSITKIIYLGNKTQSSVCSHG